VSPAKTAEEIEMPFGLRTWMGPGNHVLDRGPDPPIRPGKFEGGKGRSIVKYRDYSRLCKTAEPSKMPFWLWARMSPRNRAKCGSRVPVEGVI